MPMTKGQKPNSGKICHVIYQSKENLKESVNTNCGLDTAIYAREIQFYLKIRNLITSGRRKTYLIQIKITSKLAFSFSLKFSFDGYITWHILPENGFWPLVIGQMSTWVLQTNSYYSVRRFWGFRKSQPKAGWDWHLNSIPCVTGTWIVSLVSLWSIWSGKKLKVLNYRIVFRSTWVEVEDN